jgi:hypothetical protein
MTAKTETNEYAVTDPDAIWVAGARVPENRRVTLTETEARYELMAGTIKPVEVQTSTPSRSRVKPESEG